MFTVKSIDIVYHCCKFGGIPIFQTPGEKKISLSNKEFEKLRVKLHLKIAKLMTFVRFELLEAGVKNLEFCCMTTMVKHLPINCILYTTYHPVVSRDKTGFQNTANCDS